jgi:tetratricopeptide (TPR) repeat protein
LSTSKLREVSLGFAQGILGKSDIVGILFKISVDPSTSSAPFACIQAVSFFQTEEEILFSTHTVFRIGEITKIDNNSSLYQVELKFTADDDQQLRTLTNRIREETSAGKGWTRLCMLLAKIGQFDKAEELYTVLFDQTSIEREKACYYNNLGYLKDHQGDYEKAIWYYEKSLAMYRKTLPQNHPDMATLYTNIGIVYDNMTEYSKALSFHEKALEIEQKTLSRNDPSLAISYNNIGLAYAKMEECSKALAFYEEALEIYNKPLPSNHPSLADCYNKIGGCFLQTLAILYLLYNQIGAEGTQHLANALQQNKVTQPAMAFSLFNHSLSIFYRHSSNLTSTAIESMTMYNGVSKRFSKTMHD